MFIGISNELEVTIHLSLPLDVSRPLMAIAIAIVGDIIPIVIKGTTPQPRTRLGGVILIVRFALLSFAENKAADSLCATFALAFIEGRSGIDSEFANNGLTVSSPYAIQTFTDNLVRC